MEDLKNLFAILVSQEAEKKITNETKEDQSGTKDKNENMTASDFYDGIANWIYKTWEVDYGAGARQLGDTLSVEERAPRIDYYKLSSTLSLWTIIMATNKAVRLACSTPPPNLPLLADGSNEVAKYTKMKEKTATKLEAQIEKMNEQVKFMNRNFLTNLINRPYQSVFDEIIRTSTQIFNSMGSCMSRSSGKSQDWSRLGNVIDVVYQTIINKYLTAPTDATLKWWWQKETLLSIPSSVPISGDLKRTLDKVPKKVITKTEVNKIPETVRDLILRRVNGILLRTNLFPKGTEKENRRERFKIERERLLQEHYLNYTRSIIVRGYLINKLNNDAGKGGCGGEDFNIVQARFEERKALLYERYQELLLQRGKTKEDIKKRSELIEAFAERKILEKDEKDLEGTKFESSTQSSFMLVDKKYKKITPAQWASNIILSIHQLMLESWTYPLKSEEKGDIEYFVDKKKIFEIDAKDPGKTNISVVNVKVGKKYYYASARFPKKLKKCVIMAEYGETYTVREVIDRSLNNEDEELKLNNNGVLVGKLRLLLLYMSLANTVFKDTGFHSLFEEWNCDDPYEVPKNGWSIFGPMCRSGKNNAAPFIKDDEVLYDGKKYVVYKQTDGGKKVEISTSSKNYYLDERKTVPIEEVTRIASDNILKLLARFKFLSNGQSTAVGERMKTMRIGRRSEITSRALNSFTVESLSLGEIRVRLCKMWLVLSSMINWCNYKDLYKLPAGTGNTLGGNPLDDENLLEGAKKAAENGNKNFWNGKNSPLLMKKISRSSMSSARINNFGKKLSTSARNAKRSVKSAVQSGKKKIRRFYEGEKAAREEEEEEEEDVKERIDTSLEISNGWAYLTYKKSEGLKIMWLDLYRRRNDPEKRPSEGNRVKGRIVCKKAPRSGSNCHDDTVNWPKNDWEYWEKLDNNGNPLSGGAKCSDIRDILKRVKIPGGDISVFKNKQDKAYLGIEIQEQPTERKMFSKNSEKAMKEFAENFVTTKPTYNFGIECKECDLKEKCMIPYTLQVQEGGPVTSQQQSRDPQEKYTIKCRPLISIYDSSGVTQWILENRNRRNKGECIEMQKINGTPGKLKRKRMIDGKLSAVATATGAAATATGAAAVAAARATGKGLKFVGKKGWKGLKFVGKKAGEGLVSFKKRIDDARARNRTRKNRQRFGNRSGRATRRNRDYECDEECRERMAKVENITFLIKSTPGIKPGYTIDIIRQPNGSSAATMIGYLAGTGEKDGDAPDAIAYPPPVGDIGVEIEGEVLDAEIV
jgi:hypothetical protein